MRRKRVWLDVDGVLADFTAATLPHIQTVRPGATFADWDTYSFEEAFSLNAAEKSAVVRAIKAPGFCRNIRPFPEAYDGFHRLYDTGAEIRVVTSPWHSDTWIAERKTWLWKHFKFNEDQILFRHDKEHEDADLIVEDRFASVVAWHALRPDKVAVLWSLHHNRSHLWSHKTNDWKQVVQWLEMLP